MKAKVIATDKIIEAFQDFTQAMWFDKIQPYKSYHPNELEFLPDTHEEVKFMGWICKNEYEDGFARIHIEEPCPSLDEMPITGKQIGIWRSNGKYIISDDLFPDLKWTDSPKRVKKSQ